MRVEAPASMERLGLGSMCCSLRGGRVERGEAVSFLGQLASVKNSEAQERAGGKGRSAEGFNPAGVPLFILNGQEEPLKALSWRELSEKKRLCLKRCIRVLVRNDARG